jgi:hypothetical protein
MRLLKKDVPFFWDETAQCSFDTLKLALTTAPMLWQPNVDGQEMMRIRDHPST